MAITGSPHPPPDARARTKRWRFSLSFKLLLMTALVVVAVQLGLLIPTVASYRIDWLLERLSAARTAAMVLDATPDSAIPQALTQELLGSVGAQIIVVQTADTRRLLAVSDPPLRVDVHIDTRNITMWGAVRGAIDTLVAEDGRILRVVGDPPHARDEYVEIVISGTPLRHALQQFAALALSVSMMIALLAGAIVYVSFNWMFVRPMCLLAERMEAFRKNPEDKERILVPSGRTDEIGLVEETLEDLQRGLSQTLQQKSHLASVGMAVAKINHDLRNLLTSAQLLSDRLALVPDPTVQRFAPKLLASLDRAITYCEQTLAYGRAVDAPPRPREVRLAPLLDEVRETLELRLTRGIAWIVDVPPDARIYADPDHLYRVMLNLARNAVEALEARGPLSPDSDQIRIRARHMENGVEILFSDTGPGISREQKAHLFEAFTASARRGGAGLGLPIAEELVRAHGGEIDLAETETGTTFRIFLPDPKDQSAEKPAESQAV